MTKLTEDMIIARTKSSDLGAVKKLNCWGSDLDDVSLVKRLQNVEVLSLSLNRITSLCDFQYCRNLVELYIRRNVIRDLSELCYLQELPRLRRLLLAENPCVETAGPAYRNTVLRCLPQLEVLDNNEVTPEEVEHAIKSGLILEHPMNRRERGSPDPVYYREESPPQPQSHHQSHNRHNSSAYDYEEDAPSVVFRTSNALSRSPPPADYPYSQGEDQRSPEEVPAVTNGVGYNAVPATATTTNTNGYITSRRTSVHSSGSVIEDRTGSPTTTIITNNNNINSINSTELNSSRRIQQQSPVQDFYQGQRSDRSELTNGGGGGYQQRRGSVDYLHERTYQEPVYYDDSPPPLQRNPAALPPSSARLSNNSQQARIKPRSKSSNLLSAVLCLIPELDWASLEVVELAVRRRMDELCSD